MKQFKLYSRDRDLVFEGEIAGASTSQRDRHNHAGDFPPSRSREHKCNACRWQETTIYVTREGEYVAYTVGRSNIPGEVDYATIFTAATGRELVDQLIVKSAPKPFIPAPAARALAQAADMDDSIADAYDNRPVL